MLPAAVGGGGARRGLICPAACGGKRLGPASSNHRGADRCSRWSITSRARRSSAARPRLAPSERVSPDLKDVKGQETAKRALEIAAAGGHNLLMVGPPGAGKSMLAARLPGILPPLDPSEALEMSMVHSVAGVLRERRADPRRPFRDPHHSASLAALVGGGLRAKPGEVSLAHLGVLFLDELPEFQRAALEALRQPMESGEVIVARANAHVTFPARFQLVAAMNPCRCGYLGDPARACGRAPKCAQDYQAQDLGPAARPHRPARRVPAVIAGRPALPPPAEGSAEVGARVAAARARQSARYAGCADRRSAPMPKPKAALLDESRHPMPRAASC